MHELVDIMEGDAGEDCLTREETVWVSIEIKSQKAPRLSDVSLKVIAANKEVRNQVIVV